MAAHGHLKDHKTHKANALFSCDGSVIGTLGPLGVLALTNLLNTHRGLIVPEKSVAKMF